MRVMVVPSTKRTKGQVINWKIQNGSVGYMSWVFMCKKSSENISVNILPAFKGLSIWGGAQGNTRM